MKKSLFLIPLALGVMTACSDRDLAPDNVGGDENVDFSYLAVRIVPANANGTRAGEDNMGEYEVGDTIENEVKSIRFYFFDKDGEAQIVRGGTYTYYDAQESEIFQGWDTDSVGPVESEVASIVVIESQKGHLKPAYMVAVLNHEGNAPSLAEGAPISELQEFVSNYYTPQRGSFTMSSSVYKGSYQKYTESDTAYNESGNKNLKHDGIAENVEVIATPVYDNIRETRYEAEQHPATIYVERVLAKLSANIGMTADFTKDGDSFYKVGQVKDAASEAELDSIYVKFLGWNVTGTANKSRLVKRIDTDWEEDASPFAWNISSWNHKSFYRSYWALNPEFVGEGNKGVIENNFDFFAFDSTYPSFDESDIRLSKKGQILDTDAVRYGFGTPDGFTYLQENAGQYSEGIDPDVMTSKVIIAAQLCNSKGEPFNLIKWQGSVYPKQFALGKIANDTYIYKKDSLNPDKWVSIDANDIELVYVRLHENGDSAYAPGAEHRYYVEARLQNPNAEYAIYQGATSSSSDGLSKKADFATEEAYKEALDNALLSVGKIMCWENGYTYYWVDIQHYGSNEDQAGYYGVVRNHWYQYDFTEVKGLGVPVFEPNEIIYPEKTEEETLFYLAAQIKILQWHLVPQPNATLGW